MPDTMLSALTVDVEDWAQGYVDYRLPQSDAVMRQTARVLELFACYNVRGTFFVLGVVAKAYPQLVREIRDAGHELGVHGWRHKPLWDQTPTEFREDLRQARQAVEDACGEEVAGFRAPRFSIVRRTWWALRIVEECGFRYDSSIFPAEVPIPSRRYGIKDVPQHPFAVTPKLLEFPLTTLSVLRYRVPVGGGGYLRFLPLSAHRWALKAAIRDGRPAVLYLHPHELDAGLLKDLCVSAGLMTRLSQGFRRSRHEHLVRTLLSEFSFAPMKEVLELWMRRNGLEGSSTSTLWDSIGFTPEKERSGG